MSEEEYAEYRCSACKKEIKNLVLQCESCVRFFSHSGCAIKHRKYNEDKEIVKCEGPFRQIVLENAKTEMKKTLATGIGRERLGSTGSTGSAGVAGAAANTSTNGIDVKIDWLIRTVKEMKNEIACKNEIRTLIKQIIHEELGAFKKELYEMKRDAPAGLVGSGKSYCEAVRDKRKERVIIVKPKKEQESEATKKLVQEKIDIKNLAVGISKLRKGSGGAVILRCESEREMEKLKNTVHEQLGEDVTITEPKKIKPKIKIVNVDEEEMNLEDENLLDTIKRQNKFNEAEEGFYMRIVKKIFKEKRNDNTRNRGGRREEGSIILEVDEMTYEQMIRREKINIGWRKCIVYNHYNVKRCFKCWGYYHIAKNCIRQEICYKCAGSHKATECTASRKRCVNCMHKIKAYNLKINDEHDALSGECPTFIKALEDEKKRYGWGPTK